MAKTSNSSRFVLLVCVLVPLSLGSACSTGKPYPARIKSEYVQRDLSGKTIYLSAAKEEARIVDSRSYELGVRARALVGESVVSVRRYSAGDRAVRAFTVQNLEQFCGKPRASTDGRTHVRGGKAETSATSGPLPCKSKPLSYLNIPASFMLRVAGGFEEAGNYYNLLALDTREGTLFLATDSYGYLKADGYVAWRDADAESVVTQLGIPLEVVDVSEPIRLEGPAVRYETEEVILPDSPDFVHYDLIYAGTSRDYRGTNWHLLYKEYRRNPAGTPIYTKRLDYTEIGGAVELLGMRVQIHEANDAGLTYTVLRD